jgi:hypothetical protein
MIRPQDNGHIEFGSFTDIYELMHLNVKDLAEEPTLLQKCCPAIYSSKISTMLERNRYNYFKSVNFLNVTVIRFGKKTL